jgi:hypothetical protein
VGAHVAGGLIKGTQAHTDHPGGRGRVHQQQCCAGVDRISASLHGMCVRARVEGEARRGKCIQGCQSA